MDTIFIDDLLVSGIIGVYPEERLTKQEILINVEMQVNVSLAGETDNLEYSVDYGKVVSRITERVENSSDLLVEKLATDIAKLILNEFQVDSVVVKVSKPTIIRSVKGVGVRISRALSDFKDTTKAT